MSKKSNLFQKVVRSISDALVAQGATVRESVELPEIGISELVLREIDVLIEHDTGISKVRVAIECRDTKRPATIQWIDSLQGKYGHLEVDQVIAVSRSGFSRNAELKATITKVITMTPEAVENENWPEHFARLGIALTYHRLTIVELQVKTKPPIADLDLSFSLIPSIGSESENPDIYITLAEFIEQHREGIIGAARKYFTDNALTLWNSMSDVTKNCLIFITVPVEETDLLLNDGTTRTVVSMRIVVLVQTKMQELETKSMVLDKRTMITRAIGIDPYSDKYDVEFAVVQIAGSKLGRVLYDKRRKSSG